MLFTDSDILTALDLEQIDAESVKTAKIEKIRTDGPNSIIGLAWKQCAHKLTAAQQLYSTYLAQPGTTSGHLSAVLNVGVPSRNQPRIRLNQIVAHDPDYSNSASALQLWMAYEALALLYADASGRVDEYDRYATKASRFSQEAQKAWRLLRSAGLPMVYQPMEAPGARHSFNPGSWSGANLSTASGGTNAGTYRIAITWYDASKYVSPANNGNAESGPSEILPITVQAGQAIAVSIAGLNPPNGAPDPVGTSSGTWLPLTATHWNIYVGAQEGPLYLQAQGIPIETTSSALAGDPVLSGTALLKGQWPDLCICFENVVMAG